MSNSVLNKLLVKAIKDKDKDRVYELLNIGANPLYKFQERGKRAQLLKESIRIGNEEIYFLLKEYVRE
jgi:hypothetical protein